MAHMDSEVVRTSFNNLKESINELYSKNIAIDMTTVLRSLSKLEHLLNRDFEGLWYMEQEDNARLRALLKSAEEKALYADMPPLVAPDDTTSFVEPEDDLADNMPSVINPEEDDDEMPPLIPQDNTTIWGPNPTFHGFNGASLDLTFDWPPNMPNAAWKNYHFRPDK